MILIFGPALGFAAGLALGRRWQAFAIVAVGWYLLLAIDTASLAQPGQSGFSGKSGLSVIQGAVYWVSQPPILALSIGLLLVGAFLHRRIALHV